MNGLGEPVIGVLCNEPEGSVYREVRPMYLTLENLRTFWEKSRHFKTLFTQEIQDDFKKFVEVFLTQDSVGNPESRGLFWVIDDFVGVFYMDNIKALQDARVHYTFFDRRHRGRELLVKTMLQYTFERYKFQRLTLEVPLYATGPVFNFIKRIGFIKEGRKRKAAQFAGEWFDVNIFGILNTEVQ